MEKIRLDYLIIILIVLIVVMSGIRIKFDSALHVTPNFAETLNIH